METNPQADAAFSRRMNRCPGHRKALEIHIPSFDPLAATAVHVHISLASQRRITSHSPCRRSISQAPTQACHHFNGKGRAYGHVHVWVCVGLGIGMGGSKICILCGPRTYLERNQNDTLNDTACVAWKPRAHPSFQHPLETRVAARHSKTSHSPCRCSIPQALVRDTHTWHHCVLADPLLHNGSMRFDKHPFETQVVSWHSVEKFQNH